MVGCEEAVFQSVGHALHVSFLVCSMPAGQVSPTAVLVDKLVKENHVWDALPVAPSSMVNFHGLSPLEVRGQCAQVLSMVDHHLHVAERDAIRAMYGRQVVKAGGVRGVAAYCEPVLSSAGEYAQYVAWHVFMSTAQRDGVTQGAISDKFHSPLAAVKRDVATVRRYGLNLHSRACSELHGRFSRGGLIPMC